MAGRVYQITSNATNTLPALTGFGWKEFAHQAKLNGFEAVSFTKGNEIVIAYAGTDDSLDWLNNIDNWIGSSSSQLFSAIDYPD
jgi:hypothetical protein